MCKAHIQIKLNSAFHGGNLVKKKHKEKACGQIFMDVHKGETTQILLLVLLRSRIKSLLIQSDNNAILIREMNNKREMKQKAV